MTKDLEPKIGHSPSEYELAEPLLSRYPDAWIEFSDETGLVGVWSGVGDDDELMGAGQTRRAAIEEALETMREWGDL